MLDDIPVLFTCARVDRDTIPQDLFCYDVRHDDECQGIACEVKPFVKINHWGTIISKTEIPLEEGSYYLSDGLNYLGDTMGIEEYRLMKSEQQEAQSGMQINM